MIRRPPRSTRTDTLFPYTTLFRAQGVGISGKNAIIMPHPDAVATDFWPYDGSEAYAFLHNCDTDGNQIVEGGGDALPTFEDLRFFTFPFYDEGKSPKKTTRSEENTSEIQSLIRL